VSPRSKFSEFNLPAVGVLRFLYRRHLAGAFAGRRPFRVAPVFRPTAIETRGGAACFAFLFSAKRAGLDLALANLRCDVGSRFLPANCFQIVFGLLLRIFCGLFGVGVRLQLMDRFVQPLRLLSVSDLASGNIHAGVHTR